MLQPSPHCAQAATISGSGFSNGNFAASCVILPARSCTQETFCGSTIAPLIRKSPSGALPLATRNGMYAFQKPEYCGDRNTVLFSAPLFTAAKPLSLPSTETSRISVRPARQISMRPAGPMRRT